MMIPETLIIESLKIYQLPLVFFGSFLFGETVVISSAFFAAQGTLSLFYVIILTFFGTLLSDSIWFFVGDYVFRRKKSLKDNKRSYRVLRYINKITGRRPFLALLFIKFLYGTRILTIVYLSTRRLRYVYFLLYNTIGTILWLMVVIPIGWFAGKGVSNLVSTFNKIEYFLIFLVIFVIIFRIVTLWITKWMIKE